MYDRFPMELYMGMRRILVHNRKELIEIVLENVRFCNIFTSIYSFTSISFGKAVYESAYVDKVFFDFDVKDYQDPNEIIEILRNIKSDFGYKKSFVFSGRGFHLYVFLQPNVLKYKKDYVYNLQKDIIDRFSIKTDITCLGGLDRLARMIGTVNHKSKLYCISIDNLSMNYDNICNLSKKHCGKIFFDGTNLYPYDVKYDVKNEQYVNFSLNLECTEKQNISKDLFQLLLSTGIDIEGIPGCILRLLNKKDLGFEERTILILYLKHCGNTISECREVLKIVLDTSRYYHVTGEKIGDVEYKYRGRVEHQDINIYKKDYFLSCKQIRKSGLCIQNCAFQDVLHNLFK